MQSSFGDEALKGNFQDAFAVFPSSPVAINDHWVSNTELRSVIKAKIKTNYTLKDITGSNYLVHGDAEVQPDGLASYAEVNGYTMRWRNIKGTCINDIKLDKTTGWITESKTTKKINADVDLKDSPGMPGGMTFPVAIAADMSMDNK